MDGITNAYKALVNGKNYATRALYKTKQQALKDALCYIKMTCINPCYDFLGDPKELERSKNEPYYVVEKYLVTAYYAGWDNYDLGCSGYYEQEFVIHIIEYDIFY